MKPMAIASDKDRKKASAREALKQLQQGAHLTSAQAESYLREVREERLAADKCRHVGF